MSIQIRNPRAGEGPPVPPRRADGTLYPLELIYQAGRWRGYAESADDALDLLIEGYAELPDGLERLTARIQHAVAVQVALQAGLATGEALRECTEAQRQVLLAPRDRPPQVEVWDGPVPLVLVSSFYQPTGPLARPVEAGGRIVWLEPATAESHLRSLAAAGWLQLHQLESPSEAE